MYVYGIICVSYSQLVLALTLIGQESGACFRNQSQSPVIQNQCGCELLWHWEANTAPERCPFQSSGWEVPQGSLTFPKKYKQLIMLLHPDEMRCWAITGPLHPSSLSSCPQVLPPFRLPHCLSGCPADLSGCLQLCLVVWRQRGLMVSALDSGSSSPGASLGQGHCVVFLCKTLFAYTASLHTVV